MLELSVTSMRESESCTTNLNTPVPYTHMGLVTLMSHMIFWRENDKQHPIWTFRGVVFLGVYSLLLAEVKLLMVIFWGENKLTLLDKVHTD